MPQSSLYLELVIYLQYMSFSAWFFWIYTIFVKFA